MPDPLSSTLSVGGSTTVRRLLARLRQSRASRVGVVHRGREIGTIDVDGLSLALRHGLGRVPVRDVVVDAPVSSSGQPRRWNGRSIQDRLPKDDLATLKRLATRAAAIGTPSYLVGGVVRDLCLGRGSRDLDVVVEGDVRALGRALGGSFRSHDTFGTATVVLPSGVEIDLARARKERYARPAALPEVWPAGMEEDLRRRDFAVNALALRLTGRGLGRLLDPCGGMDDLRLRRVRALHGLSFIEDPTRTFRAVRLATELGFRIAPQTSRLIRVAVERSVVDRLSSARLRRELQRLLESSYPGKAVRLLARHGLLATIDPDLKPGSRICRALDRIPAMMRWYRKSCDETVQAWLVGLGILLRGAEPEAVDRALLRVQPGRTGRAVLLEASAGLARVERALSRSRELKPSAVFMICRSRPTAMLLMVLAGSASQRAKRRVRCYLRELRRIHPAIGGRDLLRAGVKPGPRIARGLDAALVARIDGRAPSAAAQLRVALAAAGRS